MCRAPIIRSFMKKAAIILFAVLLFSGITELRAQKVYSPDQAKSLVDSVVTIKGEVSQVSTTKGGQIYLNMGGRYPNNSFSAVILRNNTSKFENSKDYEGKTVEITGKVKIYNNMPEIVLEKKEQIKIIPAEGRK